MNASGTARPIRAAAAVPLSAIAAVGAMIAIDSAIASQKRSSRRRPLGGRVARSSGAGVSRSLRCSPRCREDRFGQERADGPVGRVDDLVDAQVGGHRGDRVRLLPRAPVALHDMRDQRPGRFLGGRQQVRADAGADVVARLLGCSPAARPGRGTAGRRCASPCARSAGRRCPSPPPPRCRTPRRRPSRRACRPRRTAPPRRRPGGTACPGAQVLDVHVPAPLRRGGTTGARRGSAGATPIVPGNGAKGRVTPRRTRPAWPPRRCSRCSATARGTRRASSPKPGMIAVHPQSWGRSSRISTASTSPGSAPLT